MNRLTLPVDVEWKATASPGEVEGYASVFGNVDKVGDVVMPGAFRKTISDWRLAAQPMPLTADHNVTTDGLIGSVSDLREDAHGLKFKARFSRSEKAQRIRQDIIDGHLRGTSFLYEPIIAKPGRFNGKTVRFLHELRLAEITVALGPLTVNELAGVTSAKAEDLTAAAIASAAEAMVEWRESMQHALGIGNELARKAAVDELVRSYPAAPDLVAATGDASGTTTDAAGDAGTSADATAPAPDAYAATFLQKQNGPPDGAPNGEPPATALPGPLADLERQRSETQIAALEADIQRALEG